MKQRILATSILWILVIVLPTFLGPLGAFLLIASFSFGAYLELVSLLRQSGRAVDPVIGATAFGTLILGLIFIPPWMMPPLALIFPVFAAITMACLLKGGTESFGAVLMPTLGTVLTMFFPFAAMILLIHESGLVIAIWVVAITKFGDVGALLTGMAIGRHKMSPTFSPNKTWEGFAGALLISILVSLLYITLAADHLPEGLTLVHGAWMAVAISLAGVLGDLSESALKREAKVKDSGGFIPGIGGFLDLTDSMLLAFPVAYSLLWLII